MGSTGRCRCRRGAASRRARGGEDGSRRCWDRWCVPCREGRRSAAGSQPRSPAGGRSSPTQRHRHSPPLEHSSVYRRNYTATCRRDAGRCRFSGSARTREGHRTQHAAARASLRPSVSFGQSIAACRKLGRIQPRQKGIENREHEELKITQCLHVCHRASILLNSKVRTDEISRSSYRAVQKPSREQFLDACVLL